MNPEPGQRVNPSIFLFIAGGLLLVVAIGLLLVSSAGKLPLNQPSNASSIERAKKGKPLSNFSLENLEGEIVQLSNFKGQIVLVNAWATWCPPCVAEMPDLQAYYQAHRDENFTILGINAGDPRSKVEAFVNREGITFPILLDPDVDLLTDLGINSFPTSILIDTNGIVQSIHIGMYTAEALDAAISPHLK